MTDDKELTDALRQLDAYTKAFVEIQTTIDRIQAKAPDIVLGPLQARLRELAAITDYFRKMEERLDEEVFGRPKDYAATLRLNLVRRLCEWMMETSERVRVNVGDAVKRAVLQ